LSQASMPRLPLAIPPGSFANLLTVLVRLCR
jgi:hypothetical protein